MNGFVDLVAKVAALMANIYTLHPESYTDAPKRPSLEAERLSSTPIRPLAAPKQGPDEGGGTCAASARAGIPPPAQGRRLPIPRHGWGFACTSNEVDMTSNAAYPRFSGRQQRTHTKNKNHAPVPRPSPPPPSLGETPQPAGSTSPRHGLEGLNKYRDQSRSLIGFFKGSSGIPTLSPSVLIQL